MIEEEAGLLYDSNGLKIYDSTKFLNMFYNGENSEIQELYKTLSDFAFKQKNKIASEIDFDEYKNIINFSLMKTLKDFKDEKGASFQSYFFIKLRGEVKAYRSKRNSLSRKINKVVNEGNYDNSELEYKYQKNGNGDENTLEMVDTSDMFDMTDREEVTKRQIKAFKMAFSGLPKKLQYILYQIGEGKKIEEIAHNMKDDKNNILEKRNNGLSLILQRVLRSRHLKEEEKLEVASMNDIIYVSGEFDSFEDY